MFVDSKQVELADAGEIEFDFGFVLVDFEAVRFEFADVAQQD